MGKSRFPMKLQLPHMHRDSTAPCSPLLHSCQYIPWNAQEAHSPSQACLGSHYSTVTGKHTLSLPCCSVLLWTTLQCCLAWKAHCHAQEDSMLHYSACTRMSASPLCTKAQCSSPCTPESPAKEPHFSPQSPLSHYRSGVATPPLGEESRKVVICTTRTTCGARFPLCFSWRKVARTLEAKAEQKLTCTT